MVTIEELQERMAQLKAEQAQVLANYNAYSGAIQECQYWIDILSAVKAEKEEE